MTELQARIRRALGGHAAETSDVSGDPRLRGRVYDIPFARVWQAAIRLANGGMRNYRLISADEIAGEISAEAHGSVIKHPSDISIRIWLDPDARTRVGMRSVSRTQRADLGANRRRVTSFLAALDRELGVAAAAGPGGAVAP